MEAEARVRIETLLNRVLDEALSNYGELVAGGDPAGVLARKAMAGEGIPPSYEGIYMLLRRYAEKVWATLMRYIDYYGQMPSREELDARLRGEAEEFVKEVLDDARLLLTEDEAHEVEVDFVSGKPVSVKAPLGLLDSLAKRMAHYHDWTSSRILPLACIYCGGKGYVEIPPPECIYCDGRGRMPCEMCGGSGEIYCSECAGRGRVKCDVCGGTGHEKCPECSGKGYSEAGELCGKCGGTGSVECSRCEGKGEVDCDRCGGTGRVKCPECGGSGEVTCAYCGGTGRVGLARRQLCPICRGSGVVELKELEPGTYGRLLEKPEVFASIEEERRKLLYEELLEELREHVKELEEEMETVSRVLREVMVECRQPAQEGREVLERVIEVARGIEIQSSLPTVSEGRCPWCGAPLDPGQIRELVEHMREERLTKAPVTCPYCRSVSLFILPA